MVRTTTATPRWPAWAARTEQPSWRGLLVSRIITGQEEAAIVAPLLKWPGGKTRELPAIQTAMPADIGRFVDPFVGGGSVLFAIPATTPATVNDACHDLIELYRRVRDAEASFLTKAGSLAQWWDGLVHLIGRHGEGLVEEFFAHPDDTPAATRQRTRARAGQVARAVEDDPPPGWDAPAASWGDAVDRLVPPKLGRMRSGERQRGHRLDLDDVRRNVEGAVRAAVYTSIRSAYNVGRRHGENSGTQAVRFLFLREYAYAAMFRFNRRGDFNVPYGGISYNRKLFSRRIEHLRSLEVIARLATTAVSDGDFDGFLQACDLGPRDLVFLDPPYDSDFSTYDGMTFGPADHRRLAARIQELPCRFQLVIKDTPLVRELYLDPRWHVQASDLRYRWTIKDRNDRAATHLLVTNVPSRGVIT